MEKQFFNFLIEIPQTLASFGNWLISPLEPNYLPISPLALLGVAGVGTIITLIVVHIVRLFI